MQVGVIFFREGFVVFVKERFHSLRKRFNLCYRFSFWDLLVSGGITKVILECTSDVLGAFEDRGA
jgi:hypothetical protein